MKKLFMIFGLFAVVLCFPVKSYAITRYIINNGKVYYQRLKYRDEMTEADTPTFKNLDYFYAKDKNNVYYHEVIIENADKKTFEVLNVSAGEEIIFGIIGYARDKDKIYRWGEKEKIIKETSKYLILESGSCFIKKDNVNMSLSKSECKE